MIMDGQVSVEDEKFVDIATSIMVGHLESHPEDMERIMTTLYEKSIPKEVLAMRMQREKDKRNARSLTFFFVIKYPFVTKVRFT